MTFLQLLINRHSLLSIDQTGTHYYKTIWCFLWSIPFVQFTVYSSIVKKYDQVSESLIGSFILLCSIVFVIRLLFKCLLSLVIPVVICCNEKPDIDSPEPPGSAKPTVTERPGSWETKMSNRVNTVLFLLSWFIIVFCFLWISQSVYSNGMTLFVMICLCNIIFEGFEILLLYCFSKCCLWRCCQISDPEYEENIAEMIKRDDNASGDV
jgi:hypothetical protein